MKKASFAITVLTLLVLAASASADSLVTTWRVEGLTESGGDQITELGLEIPFSRTDCFQLFGFVRMGGFPYTAYGSGCIIGATIHIDMTIPSYAMSIVWDTAAGATGAIAIFNEAGTIVDQGTARLLEVF